MLGGKLLAGTVPVLVALASPAAAQIWDGGHDPEGEPPQQLSPSIRPQLAEIREDIREGRQSEQLSRREARALRREARAIGGLEDRFVTGGLSESERLELNSRAGALRGLVLARRGRQPD